MSPCGHAIDTYHKTTRPLGTKRDWDVYVEITVEFVFSFTFPS